MVFQPIADLATGKTVGVEALARFASKPTRSPDKWFADATAVGLCAELELAAIRAAVAAFPTSIRAGSSRSTFAGDDLTEAFRAVMTNVPLDRISLEITEHQPIDDYDRFAMRRRRCGPPGRSLPSTTPVRAMPACGTSSTSNPTSSSSTSASRRDIDTDPSSAAAGVGAGVVRGEVSRPRSWPRGSRPRRSSRRSATLGIAFGQGYYIARPAPLPPVARRGERVLAGAPRPN